jgi:hypothetical protein
MHIKKLKNVLKRWMKMNPAQKLDIITVTKNI